MGTNYHVRENECRACGRHEEIHIGKSSAGWVFSFQYNGGRYYKTMAEMKNWLIGRQIYDEYNVKITKSDFWKMVKKSKKNKREFPRPGQIFFLDGYQFIDYPFC